MKRMISNKIFLTLIFIAFVVLTLAFNDVVDIICSLMAVIISTIAYKIHRVKFTCLGVSIPAFFVLLYAVSEVKLSIIPKIIFLIVMYIISVYEDDDDVFSPEDPYTEFMKGAGRR